MGFANLQWQCFCLVVIILTLANSQLAAARTLQVQDASTRERHEEWMACYGRVYKDINENRKRFKIFKQNVALIESSNRDANKPYKLSVNQFADLTNEFKASRNRFKGHICSTKVTSFKYGNVSAMPATMDWRKNGAITPVKDQGQCGSCWAFSAVATTEGITKLITGKLISLSEQELVDCDTSYDHGCEGGLMDNAFTFIQQNHSLASEASYPYKGVDGPCNTNKEASHAANINRFEDVPANNEEALLKAVAHQPISVAIDVGDFDFQLYSSGVSLPVSVALNWTMVLLLLGMELVTMGLNTGW